MRTRFAVLAVLALTIAAALFMLPATASATEVTGTVTAAGTGDPLQGIEVSGYFRIEGSTWGINTYVTDANGEYHASFSPGQPVIMSMRAMDRTGVFDSASSPEQAVTSSDQVNIDFQLNEDTRKPRVDLYAGLPGYYYSAAELSIDGLPDGIFDYGIVTNGNVPLSVEADDEVYRYHRYWGWADGSGIDKSCWSINGGPWVMKSPTNTDWVNWWDERALWVRHEIPTLPEGVNSVSYYAVDNNGNDSGTSSMIVVVDKTAPATKYSATRQKITLRPTDALAGVAGTFMRYGTSGAFVYDRKTATVPASGSRTIQYYSTDKAGNVENTRTLKISAPAGLSTPAPSASSVRSKKKFTVSGKVYRRSMASGYIHVYKLVNGKYRHVSKKAFTEGLTGKYKVSFKLGKGTYRFKATYGSYSATWANPPVRSKMSSRVTVR